MNRVMLIGNLVKDPESKVTTGGKTLVSFSMAVNDGKDANGQEQVQYFNLTAWEKTGEIVAKYSKKGHKLFVSGKLRNRSWDKPDGTKGYATDIVVSELELLTSKSDADRIATTASPSDSSHSSPPAPSSKSSSKADPVPEIDISSIDVSMPF